MIFQAAHIIYTDRKQDTTFQKNFSGFLRTLNYYRIPTAVSQFSDETLLKFLNIDEDKISVDNDIQEVSEKRWQNREKIYQNMKDKEIITSNIDWKQAIDLLHEYYDIRTERNQVNHAHSESAKDIPTLEIMINNLLNKLEKYN